MEKKLDKNVDIHSLYEILQDNFSIVILGKILNNFHNTEAKIAIEEFISNFSPVLIYEAYFYLKNNNLIEEEKFYRSEELKNKVRDYRMLATKKKVKESNYIENITRKMGIEFNEDVYDINVIVKNNKVRGFNFAEYNKKEEKNFLEMCYLTNEEFAKVTFKEIIKLSELDYESIINKILDRKDDEIKILEKRLSGIRYSYKSSKIFKNSKIQENDKIFILYRINILKTIIELRKSFKNIKIIIKINDTIILDINKFINKIIALEIDILGSDIMSLNTEYTNNLQQELDRKMIQGNKNFYSLSRKLRNNIHYEKIEELDSNIYDIIESSQDKYINLVYDAMQKELIFRLDEEDILMNKFFKYCNKNDISQEEIEANYANYYFQYFYTKKINRVQKNKKEWFWGRV